MKTNLKVLFVTAEATPADVAGSLPEVLAETGRSKSEPVTQHAF